ncbi:UDP-N-acetylmuramoyl-L-alanine--D-glutamate ligase [Petrotoga olearia]|uniref:UDP-N-acetylmuramoylalanine--D-glutamate ligase n=2 Tax=Petrotoga olearia TaxID=156203 RepID=A0A2K1P5K2_9BACT|nr:UDP-N-acetylmuramoyl-L-alanine--D-glutamate ligase [Petrotoga olearia]PNR98064.1 UDP-N-acetylmuramoylalanine--D-glutamate ligase [Petrotoga olearia DSM 13574]RMA75656.1 UDP-N-acetylmuramoylalanine--D-glutamate ligase [Petrotoga olearia]
MKICLVGYGKSNNELLTKLLKSNHEIFVSQDKDFTKTDEIYFKKNNIKYETDHNDFLKNCDLAIVSPGIPPNSKAAKIIFENKIDYTTELEYSWEIIKKVNKQAVFIGITGTDGKSTTTSLIGHILKVAEPLTFVGGNIGLPLAQSSEALNYYVVEVSSFQIFWSKWFSPEISVLTNLAPDHLNWHNDLNDYYETKAKLLLRTLKSGGVTIINEDSVNLLNLKDYQSSEKFITFSKNMIEGNYIKYKNKKIQVSNKMFELDIFKEDILASAVTALNLGISEKVIEQAINSFKPLKYRLELIKSINGVNYYNDSKATNVHSAYNAYKSFRGKSYIAILSGIPKNEDLTPLIEEIKTNSKVVLVFGEMEKEVKKYTLNHKFIFKNNLEEVFLYLSEICEVGDNVVFSPAGASFDKYKNYEERGEHFNSLVAKS